jgi:hypothetical protein
MLTLENESMGTSMESFACPLTKGLDSNGTSTGGIVCILRQLNDLDGIMLHELLDDPTAAVMIRTGWLRQLLLS